MWYLDQTEFTEEELLDNGFSVDDGPLWDENF